MTDAIMLLWIWLFAAAVACLIVALLPWLLLIAGILALAVCVIAKVAL